MIEGRYEAKKSKIKEPNGFTRNPHLDKYANIVLFKKKVERANRIVKIAGLPKVLHVLKSRLISFTVNRIDISQINLTNFFTSYLT